MQGFEIQDYILHEVSKTLKYKEEEDMCKPAYFYHTVQQTTGLVLEVSLYICHKLHFVVLLSECGEEESAEALLSISYYLRIW